MFWRRKVRSFEVLGERFALPTLDLAGRLDRASRLRQRLGASWLEQLSDPLLKPFRRPERRVRLGFIRAHRVLSAHEAIVFAALDHVAIYDDALVRATEHVTQRSRQKVEELLEKAAERRRVAEKAAHLASRVEDQLEADLSLIGERVRLVGKAAHLMLTRLARYRAFVSRTSRALTERERQLTAQRTLLVHDEHTFELSRELAEDRDIARWHTDPDALCAGIEESLRGMLVDLDGLEGGVAAVPEAVERLLARAEAAPPGDGALGALELDLGEAGEAAGLPRLGEVPSRLDDGDWDAVLQHEMESELVFSARSVEALGVEVVDWLDAQGTGRGRSRACAVCGQAIVGGAALGRAHVLCVRCRDQAKVGGHAWLERHGFAPVREQGSRRYESGVTRLVFEAVLGWVPSVGPAREPVTGVTWYEAIEFCNALSRREGRRPAYRIRGDKVTLRSGTPGGGLGWRLVEASVPARGSLREWRWGRVDGGAARALAHGLRPIARSGSGGVDRAVPEVREDDLSFRITCEVEAVAQSAPVRQPRSGRSASPITPRPADPATARRVVQALSLGMLVSGAAVMLAVEEASVSSANTTVVAPSVEAVVSSSAGTLVESPPPEPTPVEPTEPEPASAGAKVLVARPVDALLEEGYAARAKKDRKAARTAFDRAVVVAPEDLEARYESAREAAYSRDTNQAFLHLEVVRQAATTEPKAHRLLMQALSEADFVRLKRDKRWKTIEAATR